MKLKNYLKWIKAEFVYNGKFCFSCFYKHEGIVFKSFGKTYYD